MVSDSIPNASIPSSNPRDFAKKKRANRSAKLKQCKIDARREQWLSHVKSKGESKKEVNGGGIACSVASVLLENRSSQHVSNLEIKIKTEEKIFGDESSIHNCSDSESPTSHTSSVSGSSVSIANFTASSRSSSSSISTNGFYSNMSEEEEEEVEADNDDCLDDWEAVADALAANDNKNNTEFDCPPTKHEQSTEISKPSVNPIHHENKRTASLVNCCAWRADDAFRPKALPNLSKQYSFPLKSERHFRPIPTACPICFEDLDNTDSSFLPCACGFMLCLFCHKRIVEEDGRCPGCRKEYEVGIDEGTIRLARCCSMVTRS